MKITRWWFYLIAFMISFIDLSWELLSGYSGGYTIIENIGFCVATIGSIVLTYLKPIKGRWTIKDVLFSGIILYAIREINFYLFVITGFTPWVYSALLPETSDVAGNGGGLFVIFIKQGYLLCVVLHTVIWGMMFILKRVFLEPSYKTVIRDFPGNYRIVRLNNGREVLVHANNEMCYRYTEMIGRESISDYEVIGTVIAIRTVPRHRKRKHDDFSFYMLDTVNNRVRVFDNEMEYDAAIRQALCNNGY